MSRKSTTCIGKSSGQPVTEYDSEREAWQGASSHRELVPYKCSKCSQWHLAPKSRQTPSKACKHCRGVNGEPKQAYNSKSDADKRARILSDEQGVHLRVYKCKHGSGWHLTRG